MQKLPAPQAIPLHHFANLQNHPVGIGVQPVHLYNLTLMFYFHRCTTFYFSQGGFLPGRNRTGFGFSTGFSAGIGTSSSTVV